jgi:hypothetical protein
MGYLYVVKKERRKEKGERRKEKEKGKSEQLNAEFWSISKTPRYQDHTTAGLYDF